ncbi:apolipoprotein N-acyltransferase [bacterium]|nr:apolipoprotein N-acyltransferase [bacterium]
MTRGLGWKQIAAAVVSGLMVAGLFPPFHFAPLVWLALMPLLAALGSVSGKRAGWKGFGIGFLAGVVSGWIQFNWLATVSTLAAVLLPVYLALYWGAFGAFAATLGKPRKNGGLGATLRAAFVLGAVWAGLEWLRGWLFTGFSWNPLGVAFHESPVMAQGADLFGVLGLSLLVVFFQSVVVQAAREKFRRRGALRVAALGVVVLFGYGKFRIARESAAESLRLKTLLVQINIPQDAGEVLWTDLEIHQAYEDETLKALDALKSPDGTRSAAWPDWVMWPECALTGRILRTPDGDWGTWQINRDTLDQVRQAGPFSLIYGVNELEAEKSGTDLVMKTNGRAYNSIAVMSPEDELQTYRKRHLVIFGETIPFVDSLPFLKKIYEQQSGMEFGGSFTAGESLEPLPIAAGETAIGAIPTVCFEDSVARLTRKFARPGPQVIINVTNDGWFKQSPAAAQHFANARFRAIELRRPMLRCANSGVSAAVDSTGATAHPDRGSRQVLVDAAGSHFTRGSLLTELKIPRQPSFSLYARIGDLGILLLTALALVLAVFYREKPLPAACD